MNFKQAIETGFRKYFVFSERACRSEFWFWTLFVWVAGILLSVVDGALFSSVAVEGSGPLSGLFSLAVLIPNISIGVRRLHDIDKSGWWLLLLLIPLIGLIILIIWFVRRGTEGPNRFGPDPLAHIEAAPQA
ncbi:MAG: DUF805 domain-containing protein [Alphaproteobacteria bacterium]|nr:DUF805 domain-containing protein [Alphaproteobacteria bacterium]